MCVLYVCSILTKHHIEQRAATCISIINTHAVLCDVLLGLTGLLYIYEHI